MKDVLLYSATLKTRDGETREGTMMVAPSARGRIRVSFFTEPTASSWNVLDVMPTSTWQRKSKREEALARIGISNPVRQRNPRARR